MSRGGQWRLVAASLRACAVIAVIAGVGWGVWLVAGALQENPGTMPAVGRTVPMKAPELRTSPDGVLARDADWLTRALALPKGAVLMELDLESLRDRVLADGQVATATVTRRFPDRLVVQITERFPVARVMTEIAGQRRRLLIAPDGVAFDGVGFDADLIDSLPWLGGVAIERKGGRFLPVGGMDLVSELITTARSNADHLYRRWHVISLERLESDRQIVVRTREPLPLTIVFRADAREERVRREHSFLQQIAKLDYLWELLAAQPMQHARVDLSLGRQVPVRIDGVAVERPDSAATVVVPRSTASIFSPALQSKFQREL